jgi:hypothetical protein
MLMTSQIQLDKMKNVKHYTYPMVSSCNLIINILFRGIKLWVKVLLARWRVEPWKCQELENDFLSLMVPVNKENNSFHY